MSIRKTPFVNNEFYHIYNRGNSKQPIFNDNADYHHFIKLLFLTNSINNFKSRSITNRFTDFERGKRIVNIGAYCLMPNHFHILISQSEEEGISRFMQKMQRVQTMLMQTLIQLVITKQLMLKLTKLNLSIISG